MKLSPVAKTIAASLFLSALLIGCANNRPSNELSSSRLTDLTIFTLPYALSINTNEPIAEQLTMSPLTNFFARYVDESGIISPVNDLGIVITGLRNPVAFFTGELEFLVSVSRNANGRFNMFEPVVEVSAGGTRNEVVRLRLNGRFLVIEPEYELHLDPFWRNPPAGYVQAFYYVDAISSTNIVSRSAGANVDATIGSKGVSIGYNQTRSNTLAFNFSNVVFASFSRQLLNAQPTNNSITLNPTQIPAAIAVQVGSTLDYLNVNRVEHTSANIRLLGRERILNQGCWMNLHKWMAIRYEGIHDGLARFETLQFTPRSTVESGIRLRFKEDGCIDSADTRISDWLNDAMELHRERRWNEALSKFLEVLTISPGHQAAQVRMIECLLYLDQFQRARQVIRQTLQWSELSPSVQGRLHSLMGITEKHFGNIEQSRDENIRAIRSIGSCLTEECTRGLLLAHANLGVWYSLYGTNLSLALEHYDAAIDLGARLQDKANLVEDQINRAKALRVFGRPEEALQAFQKISYAASSLRAQIAIAWGKARCLEDLESSDAGEHYETAMNLVPANRPEFGRLAGRLKGDYGAYLSKTNRERARDLLRSSLMTALELKDLEGVATQMGLLSNYYWIHGETRAASLLAYLSLPILQRTPTNETRQLLDEIEARLRANKKLIEHLQADAVLEQVSEILTVDISLLVYGLAPES